MTMTMLILVLLIWQQRLADIREKSIAHVNLDHGFNIYKKGYIYR